MSFSEPLASADLAWLRMDHPTNQMVVCGVLVFDGPLDRERLEAAVRERLLPFGRFRSRVARDDSAPAWEEDPRFDLRAHLHRVALPAPAGQAELEELAADLLSTPLDPTKPLWQMHLVDRFGEGSALVVRIHHAIADGIALVRLLLSMTDATASAPHASPAAVPHEIENPIWELLRPASALAGGAAQAAGLLFHESVEILRHPSHLLELARRGIDVAEAVARLAALPADSETMFKAPLGVVKRVAWTGGIRLDEAKRLGHGLGATVNDVLLSALAGAFRRYLRARQRPVEGVELRILMPIDLRPVEDLPKLGNCFGLVYVDLPVGIEEPTARVLEVARRTRAMKSSIDAPVSYGILQAIGAASADIERRAIELFSEKATAVVTNVPGPRAKLYLAGRRLERMMFWVPQSGRVGLGVSILSYAHEISIGLATDAGLLPDPHRLLDSVHAELSALADALARGAG